MATKSTKARRAQPAKVKWEDHAGRRVVIHAAVGSAAAQNAAGYVKPADGIVAELESLLGATKEEAATPVDIYLIDPLPEVPSALTDGAAVGKELTDAPESALEGAGERGVVHFLAGQEPPSALGPGIAEFVVRKWFSPEAAAAGILIEGLGALAAARSGAGASVDDANEWVRQELAAGRPISIIGRDDPGDAAPMETAEAAAEKAAQPEADEPPPPPPMADTDTDVELIEGPEEAWAPGGGSGPPPPAAAASFMQYLMTSSDPGSVRSFFEAYTPDRRDDAALKAFRQPLPALEEQWRNSLGGQKAPSTFTFFKFLTPLLKPHMLRYAETLGYMVIAGLFAVALPLVSGCVVDALANAGVPGYEAGGLCGVVAPSLTTGRLLTIAVILVIAYLIQSAIEIRRAYVEAKLYNQIGVTLRERLFAHLLRLPQKFYAQARVGDIASRLSTDLDTLQAGVQQIFSGGVFLLLISMMAAITALLKSWMVGGVILLIVPVFVIVNRVLGKRIAQRSYEISELAGQSAAILQETLSAQQVVKAFGLERRVMSSYLGRLTAMVRAAISLMLTGHLYEGTITFATTLAELLVLIVGSLLVINGTIAEPGTLVTLFLLLPSIIGPLKQLADMGEVVQTASGSMQRATQILDEPVDIEDKPDAIDLPPVKEQIEFEDIRFGYDADRVILNGLNLTIPHGTNLAVVGPSGSGKSTVVNLLLRFWDPDDGRVLVDGHDIKDIKMGSLRDQIGIVFQETFIFNTTLRDNIGMARPGATDEEIMDAADQAQLQSLVESLPNGYDTVLGERGVRMSGGQRQRLAIARALLRDPAILIFDEATSALDARTEAEIRETISQVVGGRTTISITHRLGIAADADLIAVLDGGVVAELGNHKDLVKAGGLYQSLYEEQMGSATAGGKPRLGPEAARLKKVPMFADLQGDTLADLADRLLLEKFAAGEDIVRQGDPGEKLYIITQGKADVLVRSGRGERRVNTVKTGDFFGDYALLTGEERTATVRATAPMEVYSLAKDDFTALVEREAKLKKKISDFVTQRRATFAAAAEAVGLTPEPGK